MNKIIFFLLVSFSNVSWAADVYDPNLLIGEWLQTSDGGLLSNEKHEYLRINSDLSAVLVTDFKGAWDNVKILDFELIESNKEAGALIWKFTSKQTPLRMRLVLSALNWGQEKEKLKLATGVLYMYNAEGENITLFNTLWKRFGPYTPEPKGMSTVFRDAINHSKR